LLTGFVLAFTLTSTELLWYGAVAVPSIACFPYKKLYQVH
jgi:hypothetical protein